MSTKISSYNIQPEALETLGGGPTVTNIQITDSSYNVLDDTAVSTDGGYLKITGTNFASGCEVVIGSVNATSVTFVSSTVLHVQVPAATAGTYIVYVVNNDGGVAIRVNGLTYSATLTWVTGSTLTPGTIDNPISIQLNASGAISYQLQSGSTLPPGLTLTSGGLLSGTVTGITSDTVYNFTVEAVDNELQDSPRAFSISITAGDQGWNYVTTLLSPQLSTLPFNNDVSTNTFAITVNGDVKPNNFNPYTPGYYSAYFDGSGDYLSVPNNALLTLTGGDYTLEAWIYTTKTSDYQVIIGKRGSSTREYQLWLDLDTRRLACSSSAGSNYISTQVVPLETWSHVAVSVVGGTSNSTARLFFNGVLVSTFTNFDNSLPRSDNILIGSLTDGQSFQGYISNARIVKGTALYTANFTPPTEPLTAISGISLLTCQSNRFIDNSANNFTITRFGDTRIDGFVPFLPNSNYSSYGSAYFDGTTDFLTVVGSGSVVRSSGSFTIEGWYYPTSAAAVFRAVYSSGTGYATAGRLYQNNTTLSLYWGTSSGVTGSIGWTLNTWNHFAVTWDGTTTKVYVNGQQTISSTSPTYSGTTDLSIGESTYSPFGYISNFRIVDSVIYTSSFTPPIVPLTAISGTRLLTCQTNQPQNNSVFLDSSTNNSLITRLGNATQGAFSPYGENWSNYFDGTNDYLTTPSNAAFTLGTGDFTMECWFNRTGSNSGSSTLFDLRTAEPSIAPNLYIHGSGGATPLQLEYYVNGAARIITTIAPAANTWYHVAVVRFSGITKMYLNGTQVGSNYTDSNNYVGTILTVGGRFAATAGDFRSWFGYISNARIVKGTAVYTDNFTPSITPLQPIANTSLLTCRDPNIVDDSPNSFTITRNGDVSVQKFGPFAGTTLPTPAYSTYFSSATSDYLGIAGVPIPATGPFTIEFWIFYPTAPTETKWIYNQRNAGDANRFGIVLKSSMEIAVSHASSTPTEPVVTSAMAANVWNHYALTRDESNNLRAFLNGNLEATYANFGSVAQINAVIGRIAEASLYYITGYISNLRVVAGTALYTSNFTPSTTTLTAVSGTTLLIGNSTTIRDNSANNFTVTVNGAVRVRTVAPFTVSYSFKQSYTPTVFGGSIYLDGTGDYLTIANNLSNQISTSRYTIEFWMYPTLVNSTERNLINKNGSTTYGYTFRLTTGNKMGYYTDGTGNTILSTTTIVANIWYHVAATFDGTTTRLFINGIQEASTTAWTSITNDTGTLFIGARQSAPTTMLFRGYISDPRIIKGSALYTSNFVPQNQPLISETNTTLLLNGTAGEVIDYSGINNLETLGDTRVSRQIVKYGNTSIYFDGTGDYLILNNNPNLEMESGDFTYELWIYALASGSPSGLISKRADSSVANDGMNLDLDGLAPRILVSNDGISWGINATSSISISLNAWAHIAVTRSGNTFTIWVNGASGATATLSGRISSSTSNLAIGARGADGSSLFTGYMSDIRITKGVARYTSTFTPPPGSHQTK